MIDRVDGLDEDFDVKKEVYFISGKIDKIERLIAKAKEDKKKKADALFKKRGYGGLLHKLKGE